MFWKIIIFLLLAFSMIGFFYQIRKTHLISSTIQQAVNKLDETAAQREKEAKRNLLSQNSSEKEGFFEKLLQKPRKRFLYSRLGYLIPGLTIEIWIVLKTGIAVAVYFIGYAFLKSVFLAGIAAAIFLAATYAVEVLMTLKNFRAVDDNLIQFINMLANFSATSGEITSIFYKISRYMPEPLNSVLEECYIDAQTSGNTSVALYALAEKIEHPKFKDLIRNIEACVNYTSNFKSAVDNSRKLILDEQRAKRERKAVANNAVINMFLICVMLTASLLIVELLVEQSIWSIFINEGIGRICLVVIIITLSLFSYTIAKAER